MITKKSCPFCGSNSLKVVGHLEWEDGAPYADKPVSNVACESCGAQGPTINDDNYNYNDEDGKAKAAFKKWDKRVV